MHFPNNDAATGLQQTDIIILDEKEGSIEVKRMVVEKSSYESLARSVFSMTKDFIKPFADPRVDRTKILSSDYENLPIVLILQLLMQFIGKELVNVPFKAGKTEAEFKGIVPEKNKKYWMVVDIVATS